MRADKLTERINFKIDSMTEEEIEEIYQKLGFKTKSSYLRRCVRKQLQRDKEKEIRSV